LNRRRLPADRFCTFRSTGCVSAYKLWSGHRTRTLFSGRQSSGTTAISVIKPSPTGLHCLHRGSEVARMRRATCLAGRIECRTGTHRPRVRRLVRSSQRLRNVPAHPKNKSPGKEVTERSWTSFELVEIEITSADAGCIAARGSFLVEMLRRIAAVIEVRERVVAALNCSFLRSSCLSGGLHAEVRDEGSTFNHRGL